MHELSVAMALLDRIEAVAAARGAIRVLRATIRVGPLSGVEPALLMRAFEVARLARAATTETLLVTATAEVRVACAKCGCEAAASVNNLACPGCGGRCTRLLQGDELLLLQVELHEPEPAVLSCSSPGEQPEGKRHV